MFYHAGLRVRENDDKDVSVFVSCLHDFMLACLRFGRKRAFSEYVCQVGCVNRRVHEWFYVCEEYTRQESSLITKAKPNQWQQQHINTNTNPHNIRLGCYHISVTDAFSIITPTTSSPTHCTHVHIQTHRHTLTHTSKTCITHHRLTHLERACLVPCVRRSHYLTHCET